MTKLQERLRISDERLVDWNDALERRSHFGPHACITVMCYELKELLDNRKALDAAEAEIARLEILLEDAKADALRLHKEKCDLLYPETATQPPAVAEDVVERATKVLREEYGTSLHVPEYRWIAKTLYDANLLRTDKEPV